MLYVKRKVAAYITRDDQLLVFHEPHAPEAGVQVPGGTMEAGEDPREAVLREAREETGLDGLELVAYLGRHESTLEVRNGERIAIQRHYFHLRLQGDAPQRWRHWEMTPSEGEDGPILLELWWTPLGEAQALLDGWCKEKLHEIVL